jgi:prevent-host-death family protein
VAVNRKPETVRLEPGTDLLRVVEEVHADKEPRVIERNGEPLAVVISLEDYLSTHSERSVKGSKEKVLSFAGLWKDLDADVLIEEIYRARHESPSSRPVEF